MIYVLLDTTFVYLIQISCNLISFYLISIQLQIIIILDFHIIIII